MNINQDTARTLGGVYTHTHTGSLEVYFSYKKIYIRYIKTHINYVANST